MVRTFTQIGNHLIETEFDSYLELLETKIMMMIGGLLGTYLFIPTFGLLGFACGGITIEEWHNILYAFTVAIPHLIYSWFTT